MKERKGCPPDCPDRCPEPNCHMTCPRYAEFLEQMAKNKEDEAKKRARWYGSEMALDNILGYKKRKRSRRR